MGTDKIRYLVFVCGKWRWRPTAAMRAKGFALRSFGATLTAADRAEALRLNEEWDRLRRGIEPTVTRKTFPRGSIGEGYMRARAIRAQERRDAGQSRTAEQESRDDWPRAWKWIEPALGDDDPRSVTPEIMQALRSKVRERVSESEAFRVIKVWRALWKKMGAMRLCDPAADPSLAFANTAPDPRQATWNDREVKMLVQRAWRMGYRGLAACMAVAWDSQLSPIDVRSLTPAQRRADATGGYFDLDRAKTGRAAAATLSRWSETILDTYLARLGFDVLDAAAIFRTRHVLPTVKGGRTWLPRPYTKDKLGKDFAVVRAAVFGEDDQRTLADMRRSGTVEAFAGGAQASSVSTKMANTLAASSRLQKVYNPVHVATVRQVDEARKAGRERIKKEQIGGKSIMAPARQVSWRDGEDS
ncbi:hypothetical protein KHC28_00750 [Ancylobacter sonchi]|uniref:hypothetical protein n=1 Tax=Ancylobacter sonchi TaxID=1937790 RepID=UPI001BD223C7|nr:hypothetical protein [Ancylobacter sonchi]MBS7532192.1 hypothetical protein [Ancylobacter sonchi]